MIKLKKHKYICILIIILLIICFFTPILIFYHNSKSDKLITIDVEYDDLCIYGSNTPVENLSIDILRNGVLFDTIFTDSLGQYVLTVLDTADYMLNYTIKGITYSIDITESTQTVFLEVESWNIKPDFIWDNMTPVENLELDLFIWNGLSWDFLLSVMTDSLGSISRIYGLPMGLYQFELSQTTFMVEQLTLNDFLSLVVMTSIGITNSVIIIMVFNK